MSPRTESTPTGFVKRIDVSDGGLAWRVEREKARRMAELLSGEPDLATPALLDSDEATGTLVFEPLPPARAFSASEPRLWFQRAGRVLGLVHVGLSLPPELDIVRRDHEGRSGTVVLHGDFMPNNMVLTDSQLVVFDWGLRPWNTQVYTRGSGAIDLAGFLGPWLLPKWWDLRLPVRKLRAMLDTYLETVGTGSEIADLVRSTLAEEIDVQYHHRVGLIGERALVSRIPARFKLAANRSRIARMLLRLLDQ